MLDAEHLVGRPAMTSAPVRSDVAWTTRTVLGLLVIAGIATAFRLPGLGYPLWFDEGFHILAARSLLENGSLCIADCIQPYDRAAPFTWMVAGSFALFGDSLQAARLPSVVAGVLLVAAVFLWLRREVSTTAAWIAGLLCAVAPELIAWSQTSRFYAPQALLVWAGAALLYSGIVSTAGRTRVAALAGSGACFALSLQLQISTLIPVAALATWFGGWLVMRRSRVAPTVQLVAGVGTLAVAIALVLWKQDTLARMWVQYRGGANLMAAPDVGNVFFYHSWFLRTYSYLYILFPVAVGIAFVRFPRPVSLLATMFTLCLLAHSFGAFKGDRLILYTFPFFLAIWGIALAEVVPRLTVFVDAGMAALIAGAGRARAASRAVVAGGLAFAAVNTEALQTTVRLLTVSNAEWTSAPWYRGNTEWDAVAPVLRPHLDRADIVVSSALTRTLYYFGRTDVVASRTQLFATGGNAREPFAPEFWVEREAGKPVISTAESVERLVRCYPSGIFLMETGHWRLWSVVPPETADAIERLAEEIPLPVESRAKAFVWRSDPAMAIDCGGRLADWQGR